VLVDVHLYLKDVIKDLKRQVNDLMMESEKHQNVLPGYTHLQIAMPSSFGMWFSAYESLRRYHHAECSPDGCGPKPIGFRSGLRKFVPDRQNLYHKELGFETLKYNAVAAQMSRGKSEKILALP
jgi:argininosuccinate lyase